MLLREQQSGLAATFALLERAGTQIEKAVPGDQLDVFLPQAPLAASCLHVVQCAWEPTHNPSRLLRYKPLVFLSSSTRKCASLWMRASLPCFPIPQSRRMLRENLRTSFHVGPLLKIIPKKKGPTGVTINTQFWRSKEGGGNGVGCGVVYVVCLAL